MWKMKRMTGQKPLSRERQTAVKWTGSEKKSPYSTAGKERCTTFYNTIVRYPKNPYCILSGKAPLPSAFSFRSEERRVGKECRSLVSGNHCMQICDDNGA